MGLTDLLRDKSCLVRQFFDQHEEIDSARECLQLLRDTKEIQLTPASPVRASSCGGIAIEYLIRYIASGNSLDYKDTVAGAFTESHGDGLPLNRTRPYHMADTYMRLFNNVGKVYLDGRDVDDLAVYSATALAVLEGLARSGGLPESFWQEISDAKRAQIEQLACGQNYYDKRIIWLFDHYCINTLSWDHFVRDMLVMVRLFHEARRGDLSGAEFPIFSRSLKATMAHIDCVIHRNDRKILTDIKSINAKLGMSDLRQLLGYVLFHNEQADGFSITDVGIYFARSGCFRHLPANTLIRQCFPCFSSVDEAKKKSHSKSSCSEARKSPLGVPRETDGRFLRTRRTH